MGLHEARSNPLICNFTCNIIYIILQIAPKERVYREKNKEKYRINTKVLPFFRLTMIRKGTLLLFWAWTIWADMQLYDLDANPGVVMLKTGRKYTKEGNIRIYHKIDLQAYGPLIVRCKTAINSLKSFRDYEEVTSLLGHRAKKIMKIYRELYPKEEGKRKRALDFLGTGIKFITGNMDSGDRAQIEKELVAILDKENGLIRQNNQQIVINRQLETRINKMVKIIQDQHDNAIEH